MLQHFHSVKKHITYRNTILLAIAVSLIVNICLYMQTQSMLDIMKDWAYLNRYATANAMLPPQAPGRVVFMGDSITDWWNFAEYFPGEPYVNRGIGGQATEHMLIRFRPDVVDLHPEVVVILGGTNDLANSRGYQAKPIIEKNLISMAELAKANGITVVLASILPVCGSFAKKRSPHLIREVNGFIKRYCEETGIIYVDYYSALVGEDGLMMREDLSVDCLHLNVEGYKIMAPLAEEAVDRAMEKRKKTLAVK